VVLEEYPERVYVNVLYGEEPDAGGEDWLYHSLDQAMEVCERNTVLLETSGRLFPIRIGTGSA
jgi:hypothetical protein